MANRSTRVLGAAVIAVTLSRGIVAHAQPGDAASQADAFFKQAMELRSAGNDAAACPKFQASEQLAPAIGVTLYLAECYERTGRSASAWRKFREAEKLARARNDRRADVAARRAAALEPTLGRLTVSASPEAAKAGAVVHVDGAAVPQEFWGNALAVDPGDHIVSVASPGGPARTVVVHVDASHRSAVVRVGEPEASAAAVAAPAAATAEPPPVDKTSASNRQLGGRIAGIGLMVVGAASLGVGTWLATDKVQDMVDGVVRDPHLRAHAAAEAVVLFSVGGVALLSGAVTFYLNRPGRTEVSLIPAALPGGAGALLSGSF